MRPWLAVGVNYGNILRHSVEAPGEQLRGRWLVREAQLPDRLKELSRSSEPLILAAWRDEPDLTWSLVTALTSSEHRPSDVVAGWARHTPSWLRDAPSQVQIAAGDLADAYGAPILAADLFLAASEKGVGRRDFWLARAALLFRDHARPAKEGEALAALGAPAGVSEPYARIVVALLSGDTRTADRDLDRWSPSPADRALHTALRLRVLDAELNGAMPSREALDHAINLLAASLREQWTAGFAVGRARFLIWRVSRGHSPNAPADLRDAYDLAVRARDDRRRYRGDSAEAVALACQAALIADDFRSVLAVGTVARDGATEHEAAAPAIRSYVAAAAMQLGDLDLARDSASRVDDQALRARLHALAAEARGENARSHWLRAVELARDDDQQLAIALAGLADAGGLDPAQIEDFAARHPDEAAEILAMSDLATGNTDAAISQLRPRRRHSVTAALALAKAYQVAGQVDNQIRTLPERTISTTHRCTSPP